MAIPLPKSGWEAFDESFNNSNNALQKIFQGQLEKQKLKELAMQHQEDYALRQQAAQRAAHSAALQDQLAPLNMDLLKAKIEHYKNGSNGITVTTDPDTGQPLIQIGGSPRGNGQGATLINPETGEAFSRPTGATATKLQNRVIGEKQVQPILKTIIDTVPQFQSGWKQGQTALEGKLNTWFGANYKGPSDKAAGSAALSKATESLINLYGLHANARNVQEVKHILTPVEGESPKRYAARVQSELESFSQSGQTAQNQLRRGIDISQNKSNNNSVLSSQNKKTIGGKTYIKENDQWYLDEE